MNLVFIKPIFMLDIDSNIEWKNTHKKLGRRKLKVTIICLKHGNSKELRNQREINK